MSEQSDRDEVDTVSRPGEKPARQQRVSRADDAHLERADEVLLDSIFGITRKATPTAASLLPLRQQLSERLQKRFAGYLGSMPKSAARSDYRWPDELPETLNIDNRELTKRSFPCEGCGAVLHYAIGTDTLQCSYCGHRNVIENSEDVLEERDLHKALQELERANVSTSETRVIACPNCAAEFSLDAHLHAGECPFCGTHVIVDTRQLRPLSPQGILPFAVTAEQARDAYRRWLDSLWFAPGELKQHARGDTALQGVYLPYWTYDSHATTAWEGQRGDVFYVTEQYRTTENGRQVMRSRQVPRIRWSAASGRTSRYFDDVLVGATKTLPRRITDWLAPWDIDQLVPYTEDYLSGFSSEIYQVDLDEGFALARETMDRVIHSDVRQAIGGEQQRISSIRTHHSDTSFKHVLLPVWSAGFRYHGKTYRFVVNGRSGKVRGERPWSAVKVALAAISAFVLLTLLIAMMAMSGKASINDGDFNRRLDEIGSDIDWGRFEQPSNWPEVPF